MDKTNLIKPVIHIGPPKTATSSLHISVIPNLGRPYLLKPSWTKALANGFAFDSPDPLPNDIILSDERLGSFATLPPQTIAKRLAPFFKEATVVFIERDPLQQFYSFYRQVLRNEVVSHPDPQNIPLMSPDQFFDLQRFVFSKKGCGFFAMSNPAALRTAFGAYFDFQTVDFELLKSSPAKFVDAFSALCGSDARPVITQENVSSRELIADILNSLAGQISSALRMRISDLYAASRLSENRENFLRSWPGIRSSVAFVDAFRLN